MSDAVIKITGLGKCYRLKHQVDGQSYLALRDVIADKFKRLFGRRNAERARDEVEDFWALKDVSFNVKQGEVLGIIGRNGAGKSTLLKVLSRITDPTKGRVSINGRVASLLEVGTGFHPELTGRENIFLNGAVLGMKRAEIRSKFDEIVAFAEVEKFLDTPVKRYSSGMYVRLAFAVAAHLEPEILIVDEVLAVGDAAFQKKCLGKMGDVALKEGRTILFVSHSMAAVQSLCQTGVLLVQGKVAECGPVDQVVRKYVSTSTVNRMPNSTEFPGRQLRSEPIIQRALLLDERGAEVSVLPIGAQLTIRLCLASQRITRPVFGIGIDNFLGQRIVSFNSEMNTALDIAEVSGASTADCIIPSLPLVPGEYRVKLVVRGSGTDLDTIEDALAFTVEATDWFGTGRLPQSSQGTTVCKANWSITQT